MAAWEASEVHFQQKWEENQGCIISWIFSCTIETANLVMESMLTIITKKYLSA